MLLRIGSRFELYPHKVRYTQHGDTVEQWALPNKQWWTDFADKWEHTEIIEFLKVDLTEEQLQRFREIKDMPEDFTNYYTNYILSGEFPNEGALPTTHPFEIHRLKKENEQLKQRIEATDNAVLQLLLEGMM